MLNDYQRFRGKVNKLLDLLEQQLQDYIHQCILQNTMSQKVYLNVEKQYNLDLIISDVLQHVKKVEENTIYTSFIHDQSLVLTQAEYNKIYEDIMLPVKQALNSSKAQIIGLNDQLSYQQGVLTRKSKGGAKWYFATFKSLFKVKEQSMFKLKITNGGCLVVGMCECGSLEQLRYEWKGKGKEIHVVGQNGSVLQNQVHYQDADGQGDEVGFTYKTGDVLYCTQSLQTSDFTLLNITTGLTKKCQLDPSKNYEFCVGLRYIFDEVQIL